MNMASNPTPLGMDSIVAPLVITPRSILALLGVIIAILGLLHVAALPAFLMGEEGIKQLNGTGIGLLNLWNERSIGAWFTVVLLGINSALLLLNGSAMRRLRLGNAAGWLFLAAIFSYLSFDEMYGMHERIGSAVAHHFKFQNVTNYPWVVTGLVFAAVVGLSFIRFLYRLPRRTAKLFMLSGAIYVGAALGLEFVESVTETQLGVFTTLYYLEVLVEECLEMFGQALFAYALLDHLALHRMKIQFR